MLEGDVHIREKENKKKGLTNLLEIPYMLYLPSRPSAREPAMMVRAKGRVSLPFHPHPKPCFFGRAAVLELFTVLTGLGKRWKEFNSRGKVERKLSCALIVSRN